MKKIRFLFSVFAIWQILIFSNLYAQTVTVDRGALAFVSKADYDAALDADETTKQQLYAYAATLTGFTSVHMAIQNSQNYSTLEDSTLRDLEFIRYILNDRGVIKIGRYFYKIHYPRQLVYVLHEGKAAQYYSDLLTGTVTAENEMGYFHTESEVIGLTEAGYKTEPPEELSEEEAERIFCWRRRGTQSNAAKWGLYFFDESDPTWSVFSNCINQTDESPSTNSRLNIKLNYIKLGVYFSLYTIAKLQRETGEIVINDDYLWTTTDWGTGQSNWKINYDARYRGKCRNDNEITQSGFAKPPLNDKNKARKVFWEKSTGLNYYCLKVTADLYTKRAFITASNEQSSCVDLSTIFAIQDPRPVNTTEVYPYITFKISGNTPCQ